MPLKRSQINVQDEAIDQGPAAAMNFTGAGVAVTVTDGLATVTIAGGGGGGSPAGSSGSVQYNNSGTLGGTTYVESDGNFLAFVSSSTTELPPAPVPGRVRMFNHDIAGRQMLAQRDPTGYHVAFQPLLARNNIGIWDHPGNSNAAPTTWGITAPTNSGTLTARNVATTNIATMARRVGIVSVATAGNMCGFRSAVAQYNITTGFMATFRFIESDAAAVATARMWVGMTATTTAFTGTTGQPSSFVNSVGIGYNSGQRNLEMMWAGAGTSTTQSLGNSFPANTGTLNFYELTMFCPPSGSGISWRVECINTGAVVAGSIASNLPSSTTLLAPQFWRSNGTTAAAVGLDLVSLYIETDN